MVFKRILTKKDPAALLKFATTASVVTAGILIITKFAAWTLSGSVSVLASLMDSILDVAASLINLLAVRYSLAPADDEHRFGHGKAEFLAGLAQSTFIAGSALFLTLLAVNRFFHPQTIEYLPIGISVMVFSIVATLVLIGIQSYVVKRTQSVAIKADSLHYKTDLLTNLSVIVALLVSAYGFPGADPLFAIAIAFYILYGAWHIGHDSVQLLLDHELPEEEREEIRKIIHSNNRVVGIHDLRTRKSGQTRFIQLHLEFDGSMPLQEAHDVGEVVEAAIRQRFADAEVLIHHDPIALDDRTHVID